MDGSFKKTKQNKTKKEYKMSEYGMDGKPVWVDGV